MKRRDEVLVGIFVTLATIIAVIGIIWLTNGGLSSGYPLYAKFAWGQNLKKGHPILLAGQEVGHVANVDLKPGYLDVELAIDKDQKIPRGSAAQVIPVGIFGDVAIAFKPPLPLPTSSYNPGDTVAIGPPTPDMAAILARVDTIGTSVSRLATALETEFVKNGGLHDLRRLTGSMAATSDQLSRVIANQDRNVTVLLADFRTTMNRFSKMIDSAQVDSTVRNVKTMSTNMTRLLTQVDSTNREMRGILAKVSDGKGSLGLLLNDSTLYTNVRNLVATTDSLLNDFKKDPKKYINVKITVF